MDSGHHTVTVPSVAPSRVAGGTTQSSSASGIFFRWDGQMQAPIISPLNSSFGNSADSGTGWSSLRPASGDMNRVLNSAANSGPSVGASSLVTDANSSLSGGPHLQRSGSVNTEPYMRLPASPMSFSSNNISMDGSCVVQQSSHQDQNLQQAQQQQQHGAASPATSHPTSEAGSQVSTSLNSEPVQKKPRLDIRQEDILQQQFIQQLFQRRDSNHLQGQNPQLQALVQQKRLLQQQHQQQQILQSIPHVQWAHMQQQQQQQQQLQLRQQIQQNGIQAIAGLRNLYDSGICARRLLQYMYHQRKRPADNNILYWRKFVAEYFSPHAKKSWCLSLYDNAAHHSLGVFTQSAMDAWHCDICGSKSGRGFETTFEVLPRLNKIKFDSGVIDELLFVDLPSEVRFPSGIMKLECGKAVQETVYEQLHVVREGHLRIVFMPDLKILSWEFCARRHEELLPRRLVAPQVNQLLLVAQKYQSSVTESGSVGVSPKEQTNCQLFVAAGRQLAKSLDSQSLNDLGFSKRYVRCLQISEVVSSMKDLMQFSQEHSMGPIESLKNYPRRAAAAKLQKIQEVEPSTNAQGLPTDQNTLNKIMAMCSGLSSHASSSQVGSGAPSNAVPGAVALSNYQKLLRQNSVNSNQNALRQDASCSLNGSSQSITVAFQGHSPSVVGSLPSVPGNVLLSPCQQPHLPQQNQQSFHTNQHLQQQHVIHQMLQEMTNTSEGAQQRLPLDVTANGHAAERIFCGTIGSGGLPPRAGMGAVGCENKTASSSNSAPRTIPSGSNSFKNDVNTPPAGGNTNLKPGMLQNLQLGGLVQGIPCDFIEAVFSSEAGDMGYGQKS